MFVRNTLKIALALVFLIPMSGAHAQTDNIFALPEKTIDDIQTKAWRANPKFEAMARHALSNYPTKMDWVSFRRTYTQTRQYDPDGIETIEKLHKIAFTLDTTQDPDEYQAQLRAYQNLVINHMAHLGVVMELAALAESHKRYGDPKFFNWLKRGIIRTVINSGTGYTLDDAYDVITLHEEEMIFRYIRHIVQETVPNREVSIYYNMHKTQNVDTGKTYTIFVNTTLPMKFLEAKDKARTKFIEDLNKSLGFN